MQEGDANAGYASVQRANGHRVGNQRYIGVDELLGQTHRIGDRFAGEPTEIHGAPMSTMDGDRRAAAENHFAFRNARCQGSQNLPLRFRKDHRDEVSLSWPVISNPKFPRLLVQPVVHKLTRNVQDQFPKSQLLWAERPTLAAYNPLAQRVIADRLP